MPYLILEKAPTLPCSFSALLIYDKAIAKNYKNAEDADKITIITLDNKTITKVQTLTSEEKLKKAL